MKIQQYAFEINVAMNHDLLFLHEHEAIVADTNDVYHR